MSTTTKKAPAKKQETVVSENQFALKKIGANLIATIGSERYAKKVSMEESELIFKKVGAYNKKPSEKVKTAIVALLTPTAVKVKAEKEATETKLKGYKKLEKKAEKTAKKANKKKVDFIEELEAELTENKDSIEKVESLLKKLKGAEPIQAPVEGPRVHREY